MWDSVSSLGSTPQAGDTDRFVSYFLVARRLHQFRLWAAASIAIGLAITALTHGMTGVWASALLATIVAAHAATRLRWPGASPDDAVQLDNLAVLAYLALLRPPTLVVGVALIYMLTFTVLFSTKRVVSISVAYVIVGTAAITWALPARSLRSDIAAELALVFLLAGVPPIGWLFGQLASALAERSQMVSRLVVATGDLQRLFDKSAVAMYRSTPDGRLAHGNDALLELFAAPHLEAFRSHTLAERYVSPDRRVEFLTRLNAEGAVEGFDARFRRFDGSEFDGRMSASLIDTTSGVVIEGIIQDVTVELHAEKEALITEAVFDQLGSAVIVADGERHVTKWNRQAERLFGLETSEAFGRLTSDVLKGTKPGMAEEVREALAIHGYWGGEAEVVGANGEPIPMAVSAAAVSDIGGQVVAFAMVFTDVRDIHEARQQIRFQADLLAQVHNSVIATDLEGVVMYWNPGAESLYGWTAEEAVGRGIEELTVPEHGALEATEVMGSTARDGVWEGEFEVRRKDGSRFPALIANRVIHDESGRPSGIVGVSMDLSARLEAERQARRSGELARSVLDAVHFPVAVVAEDGEILDVNQAWTAFCLDNDGDPAKTGVGANYLDVCADSAQLEPALGTVLTGITDVLTRRTRSFSFDYAGHSPEAQRWFAMEVSPIVGLGAVIAHIDITAEVRARQTLEATISEKDRFLATVAHELRTPLTAVVGFAEHLRSGDARPEELPEHIAVLAEQAREVADLIEDLLLAGRLDTDTIAVRLEPLSIARLVSAVARPWTGTDIDIRIDEEAQTVLADPLRTRQILRNLVANAVKHGQPPIVIRAHREATLVLVEVIDSGSGVPSALVDHLYEPYTHLASTYGQPGSVGLGLYVSQQLARLMNGTITYRRQDDATVFTLALPVVIESAVER